MTATKGKTNVQITTETRDRLIALGGKGDSYEDVIKKLLDRVRSLEKRLEG